MGISLCPCCRSWLLLPDLGLIVVQTPRYASSTPNTVPQGDRGARGSLGPTPRKSHPSVPMSDPVHSALSSPAAAGSTHDRATQFKFPLPSSTSSPSTPSGSGIGGFAKHGGKYLLPDGATVSAPGCEIFPVDIRLLGQDLDELLHVRI